MAAVIVRLHAEGAGDKAERLLASMNQQKAMSAYSTAAGGALVAPAGTVKKKRLQQLKRALRLFGKGTK